MKADAVFEGGGMRGIGIVGALTYLEKQGYEWQRFAGTSVGAVIAALLVSGYRAADMKKIISQMNFENFLYRDKLQKLPFLGKALGVLMEKGVYSGEYVELWVDKLLRAKGICKFKDVTFDGECRLKIVASDVTKRKILILPDSLVNYGINPMEFSIAKAVRMSTSIPIYFKPVKLIHRDGISYVVDGAVSCNFPIDIFDIQGMPRWPTIGFKFDTPDIGKVKSGKKDPISFLIDIAETIAYDKRKVWMMEENLCRTVLIPTAGVEPTEFNISSEKSFALFKSGYRGALRFHHNWSFEEYIKRYRNTNKAYEKID